MKKLYTIVLCLIIGIAASFAQERSVSGVVKGKDGSTLAGVAIVVKGTTRGASSASDGSFTLSARPNSVLVATYLGYKTQEVDLGDRTSLTIILDESSEFIDDVFVVAYGTAKRESYTGSAAVIKSTDIENRQVSNITNALAGQVAGVQITKASGQPGQSATVRVRGVGSMSASNSPLYVIDGVPYDGVIAALNTADVESMTVLKDAASNALYGARGANGVILITTKKGKKGDAVITFDAKWGSNRRALPNYDVVTDPNTHMELTYGAIYGDVMRTKTGGAFPTPEQAQITANQRLISKQSGGMGYQIYTVPENQLLIGLDGKINKDAKLGYSDGHFFVTPDDWYNETFDKSNFRQEYNISISGGSDKISYFLSGGYLDDSGLMEGSGFERYTTRMNVTYQAKKWLEIGTNIGFTNYDQQYAGGASIEGTSSSANMFYVTNKMAPIYPMYIRDASGKILVDAYGYQVGDFGDQSATITEMVNGKPVMYKFPFSRSFMSMSNPLAMSSLDQENTIGDAFSGKFFATATIIEGLTVSYNFGLDLNNRKYKKLYNAFYGQYSKDGGIIYQYSYRNKAINQQQLIRYEKTFNGIHAISLLAGHETYDLEMSSLGGSRTKLYNPYVTEIDNAILKPNAFSSSDSYATEGYLFRAEYDYDSKYVVSASYRRDGSSRFHKDNRWGDFGSIGAAWVITKENFMQNIGWVNFLKFKASYGIQGNDNLLYQDGYLNYYPYADQYKLVNNNDDFAVSMSYKGNKDITWETSYSFNTGLDFSLWNGKLAGSIEYYNRKTKDLLFYRPQAISGGFPVLPSNIGSIRNFGFEFDLRSNVYSSNRINVDVFLNLTTQRNKVLKLAPELEGSFVDGSYLRKEGRSLYNLWIKNSAGLNEEGVALYYKDVLDADNKPTGERVTTTDWGAATYYESGNVLPKVFGGFGFNVDLYGFDISMGFSYQLGGRTYDNGYSATMHGGKSAGHVLHKDMLNAWSADNPNSNIPRLSFSDSYAYARSDRFIISSNYLDITNITVGYTLPDNWVNKIHLSKLRIYVAADNVHVFSKRKGLDPRLASATAGGAAYYSPIRTISGGISFKF